MSDQLNQFGIIQNLQMSPYSPNQFLDWDFFCRFLQQDSSTILIVCIINQVIQRAHISVLKYELGMSIIKQVNTYSYQEEVCSSQYYVLSEQILNKVQLVSVVLARARCSRHVIFCLTMCNRKQDLVLFFSRVVIPHFMRRQLLCEKITISGGQVCTFYPCTTAVSSCSSPVTQRVPFA